MVTVVPIPGYPDYHCGLDGSIWLTKDAGVTYQRVPVSKSTKYALVNLRNPDGKRKTFALHRIVAMCYLGPVPFPKAQVRHLDGNPFNCAVENLAYGTASENWRDKFSVGTATVGDNHPGSRLTQAQRMEIISAAAGGESQRSIARRYGVSHTTIHHLVKNSPTMEHIAMDRAWEAFENGQ